MAGKNLLLSAWLTVNRQFIIATSAAACRKGESMLSLDGRVALVTGASQGIGRACAVALAKAGAKVALAARNEEKLQQAVSDIAQAGGEAAAFKIDVGDEDSIKQGVKAAIEKFGKIEILVNNAGV